MVPNLSVNFRHLGNYRFGCGHEDNHQITHATQGGAAGSIRLLLTKNTARSLSCPGCQGPGITFDLFPRQGYVSVQLCGKQLHSKSKYFISHGPTWALLQQDDK